MKLIDKLIKKLNTDRNTFVTYILTLISVYIVADRVVEMLLIGFSGISYSYWGPIKYTLAMMCPVFAFYFSFSSKLLKYERQKLEFFYLYAVVLYIIVLSMAIQWANYLSWFLLFSVPNYKFIIANFMDLIKPALTAFAWYIPICTVYPLFNWIYCKLNDSKMIRDSIEDYTGIDLSDTKEGTGPYSFEVAFCKDFESGKLVKIPEGRRYESTLIIGNSGCGKTSMIFEPMIARDMERKYFLKEASKELGFTALKTGIASVNSPYSNEYMNENFSLNMLTPANDKEKVYKTFLSKLILNYSETNAVYKNLGLTYLAPDHESLDKMVDVAKNYNLKYNLIDPEDANSVGLNPFANDDPIQTALLVSTIFKRMYFSNLEEKAVTGTGDANLTLTMQAIEALTLVLKETYPLINEGEIPTIEDLLDLINDFDKVQDLVSEAKESIEISKKYKLQIQFLENYLSDKSPMKNETLFSLQSAASQFEQLLYHPGVKRILCNQNKNVDYNKALKNGEVVLICTRRGELGSTVHKAFGLYILLFMQQAVLTRPGNEKTRIPHFLYIDEFSPFSCKASEDMFTLYRKYRVGVIISAQNLGQLGPKTNTIRQTILANCTTKLTFGNNDPDDDDWWQQEFGIKREWQWKSDYKTDDVQYDSKFGDIKYAWIPNITSGRLHKLPFKVAYYKTKDAKGENIVGKARVDFLESKYKEKQKVKMFDFAKFTNGISEFKKNGLEEGYEEGDPIS